MEKDIKNKFVNGILWKFSERILAQVISLVVTVLLARILTPKDYGVVGIVLIFISFSQIIVVGGLTTSLVQKKDADALDYSTMLCVSVSVAMAFYFLLFVAAPYIAKYYGVPLLVSVIRTLGLILPIAAVQSVWSAYISTHLQFKKFFFSNICALIISGGVGIWMALYDYGAWALVAQYMLHMGITTLILIVTTPIKLILEISFKRFKKLFGYGWKILVSNLIGQIYVELNPLFIGLKYSVTDLSFYAEGRIFPSVLSSTLVGTFSSVLFPVMVRYQNNKDALLNYTRKFMRLSSFVVFPAMIGFMAVADNFVKAILTDKWIEAVPYLQIFSLAMMFDVVAAGNCETIKAMGRSDIYLKMEIVKKVGYFITIGVFIYFTSSPLALASSLLVCELIQILVNSYPNIKLIGYEYKYQFMDLLPNVFMSVIMGIVVYSIKTITGIPICDLTIQILTGIVVYVFICVALKSENFALVRDLIIEKFYR